MRILSKKSFRFDDPNKEQPSVTVMAKQIVPVPNWVADTQLFKMAVKDESISIIDSPKAAAIAENSLADEENSQAASRRNAGKKTDTEAKAGE